MNTTHYLRFPAQKLIHPPNKRLVHHECKAYSLSFTNKTDEVGDTTLEEPERYDDLAYFSVERTGWA
jgi:hypothetical protein